MTAAYLVFGASQRTGLEVAKILAARGDRVTAFVRPTSDRSGLEPLGVDLAVGDPIVNQGVCQCLDVRAHAFDTLLRKNLVHQTAVDLVAGRILGQQGFHHGKTLLINRLNSRGRRICIDQFAKIIGKTLVIAQHLSDIAVAGDEKHVTVR